MGFVYHLEFSDGKSYVGITTKTLQRRWGQHKAAAIRGKSPVYRAWRRLGEPRLSVLMEVENSHLKGDEIAMIALLNCKCPNGYNASDGGDGCGQIISDDARAKMSAAKKGHRMSESNKQKIRAAIVGRVKSPEEIEKLRIAGSGKKFGVERCRNIGLSKLGTKLSDDHKRKISARHLGRKNTPETIAKMSASAKAREQRKRGAVA